MKLLTRIYATPPNLLTDDEIAKLDPSSRAFVRRAQRRKARYDACPAHERVQISNKNGWNSGRCRHCGMDMSGD